MLAVALDDFTLNVLDMETKRIVRKFSGHRGQVNDMVSRYLDLFPFLCLAHLSRFDFTLTLSLKYLFLSDDTPQSFSPDGRWLITAAMDCTIRTWDLPSGW